MLYIIMGPPAAGKSTYVRSRAKPSDVVIDLDVIARSLAGPGASTHNHAPAVLKVAQRARRAAIDEALLIKDADVWLIHSAPSQAHRARYKRVGGTFVTVDPGRDVVAQRIAEQRRPALQAAATRWYAQHARHSPRSGRQASREW